MQPTNVKNPDYFHKVVDCQWACPAHTPVPEYIRMIAAGKYGDAYMVNWKSNVFPGILGRTCDRPCEPACRRGRVEDENLAKPEPVAICRLKRVAADLKDKKEIEEVEEVGDEADPRSLAFPSSTKSCMTLLTDSVAFSYIENSLSYFTVFKGSGVRFRLILTILATPLFTLP